MTTYDNSTNEAASIPAESDPRIAKACDEWLDSPEGARAQDAWTLLGSSDPDRYLRNRLTRAFLAGMEAERLAAALACQANVTVSNIKT